MFQQVTLIVRFVSTMFRQIMFVSTGNNSQIADKRTTLESFLFELIDLKMMASYKVDVFTPSAFEYISETYQICSSLCDKLLTLRHVEGYLGITPFPKYYQDSGIQEIDYYRYHIENYHVKFISVIDFSSLLINKVIELGIEREKCNPFEVLKHEKSNNQEVLQGLAEMCLKFKSIKVDRHKIVHRANFESDTLENLDDYVNSEFLSQIISYNEEVGNIEYFENSKEKILSNTIQTFKGQIHQLEIHIDEIVSFLINDFRINLQKHNA